MKKFKFQLDTVLRYKGQVLETRLGEHGQVLAQVNRQEEVLEQAQDTLREYLQEYREKQAQGMTVIDCMRYQMGIEVLEKDVQREEEKLQRLRQLEEEKRARVVEAKQETSTLERLKEIKLGEYNSAAAKEEEKRIDDLVGSRRAAQN